MFSATSQKYVHDVPALGPRNMYVGSNGLIRNYTTTPQPSTKKSYMTVQTVVLTFSVLFCVFCCFLTVTLSYKWYTDTSMMFGRIEGAIGELMHDVNALSDLIKDDRVYRRLNNLHKEPKNDNDENNYEDLEDDYDENQFMGKDLSDNKHATINQGDSHKMNNRERRNAEIDAAIKVKNELNGPNNEKSNVEILEEETTTEENSVKVYNRQKPKKVVILKKKPQVDDEEMEDLKEEQEIAAAHFTSDSSKYNKKTHTIYDGNGRLKHPDGDFRDWTHCIWDTNLKNSNSIQMKNGKVEISKPGLYYVYAQIYYSDQHDINGYYIMKNDEKILGCTTTRHRETQSDSCYTGGLINFKSNDILSIKGLDSERYILLDKTKTFFGLFKVL